MSAVDSPLMVLAASVSLSVGLFLLINRERMADWNTAGIRELRRLYGAGLTDQVAASSTPRRMVILGICSLLFGVLSLAILLLLLQTPPSVASTGMAAVVGSVQIVLASVLLLRARTMGRRATSLQGSALIRTRLRTSGILVGLCGALTLLTLFLLHVAHGAG